MTKSTLHRLLTAAQDCGDIEEYIADQDGSLSVRLLTDLWNLSRDLSFRSIRKFSGLTQRAFAQTYGIPQRTVENWDEGHREPPAYLLELILSDILTAREESYTAEQKTYYLPTADYWDTAFADAEPVCVDRKEADRLYRDWYGEYGANFDTSDFNTEFDDLWREADEDEIAEYGTYDS